MNPPLPHPAKIVVFGPYKTGTTGLFYRIAHSLPEAPRELFERLAHETEPGDDRRWVLAKAILWYPDGGERVQLDTFLGFDKQILQVRDPRDWIVSATLFFIQQDPSLYADDEKMGTILDALRAKQDRPSSRSLQQLLALTMELSGKHDFAQVVEWIRRHLAWLPEFEARLAGHFRLRYEDFVDDRLEALEGYLGLALTGTAQVPAEYDHVPRTLGHGNWRDWFGDEDVDFFRPLFRDFMARYDYEDDWSLNPQPEIRPAHGTEYVLRTVNKRRRTPLSLDSHGG